MIRKIPLIERCPSRYFTSTRSCLFAMQSQGRSSFDFTLFHFITHFLCFSTSKTVRPNRSARYGFRGYTRIPIDEVALSDPLTKSPLLEAKSKTLSSTETKSFHFFND